MSQISYKQELLRKLIHLSSLWMVFSIGTFPRSFNIFLFGALLVLLILVEYGNYKKWPLFTKTYGKFFNRILRPKETGEHFSISGAPYVLASALMVSILFPPIIAMVALAIMLIGDTAAALVGRKFGRHKINAGTKSIEGSVAFWIASTCVLLFFVSLFSLPYSFTIRGIVGLTCAMFAEIYEKQIHMDDNFSIPLITGLLLYGSIA